MVRSPGRRVSRSVGLAIPTIVFSVLTPVGCRDEGMNVPGPASDGGSPAPGSLCAPCGPSVAKACDTGLLCREPWCQPDDGNHVSCVPPGTQGPCMPCVADADCGSTKCNSGGACVSSLYCAPGTPTCGPGEYCGFTQGGPGFECRCGGPMDAGPDVAPPPVDASMADACDGPVIDAFAPLLGIPGDTVTITGTKLGGAGAVVLFGGGVAAQTTSSSTDTMVAVLVPMLGSTGPIAIAGPPQGFAPCTVYSSQPFGYRSVTGITPIATKGGLPGTKVTIVGAFLGGTGATVDFYDPTTQANDLAGAVDPGSTDAQLQVTIPEGTGQMGPVEIRIANDTLTAASNYPILASFHMTCTSTGGSVPAGQTWGAAGAFYADGGTSGHVFFAGFRNWTFSKVPGTLSKGMLQVSGSADGSPSVTVSLNGTVSPDGTGSGTGSETDAAGTVTFTWTSTP